MYLSVDVIDVYYIKKGLYGHLYQIFMCVMDDKTHCSSSWSYLD